MQLCPPRPAGSLSLAACQLPLCLVSLKGSCSRITQTIVAYGCAFDFSSHPPSLSLFAAWFNPADAFKVQKSLNEEGQSPPFCSEF